jgi:YVTN family beta-propeller protein
LAATIPVGRRPYALAVHPNTGRVYVASLDDATVSVIDPATNTVTATIRSAPGRRAWPCTRGSAGST